MQGSPVEFEIRTPVENGALARQMQFNLSRNLRDVPVGKPKRKAINIIASGPSALLAPFHSAPTLSLNNSLKLFADRDTQPTYWAACDPQEIVASFIPDEPPKNTTYLVASKCHPAVFDKLKDRKVLVWHVDDCGKEHLGGRIAIPTAVSITLCALNLSRLMGYFDMNVWGWDGCYIDGKDHALGQPHDTTHDVTVTFPDQRTYSTTHTWAAEAQDAVNQMQVADYTVNVEGDGMIKAMLGHFAQTRLAA